MEGVSENHEVNNNNIALSVGTMIDTYFGWEAVIVKIDESKYKFGQGLRVKRLKDSAIFSICPSDIKVAFFF